mmetsp:Transcript_35869/g.80984  ORF Transcript_35869/g.80984 Transcript_35869/m.80984 type:complete len:218 (-) Transcript_35869:815-1468(-)
MLSSIELPEELPDICVSQSASTLAMPSVRYRASAVKLSASACTRACNCPDDPSFSLDCCAMLTASCAYRCASAARLCTCCCPPCKRVTSPTISCCSVSTRAMMAFRVLSTRESNPDSPACCMEICCNRSVKPWILASAVSSRRCHCSIASSLWRDVPLLCATSSRRCSILSKRSVDGCACISEYIFINSACCRANCLCSASKPGLTPADLNVIDNRS